jgi:hypothetical protein
VQFVWLAVDQVRDMEGGGLVTFLAFHRFSRSPARTDHPSALTYLQHNPAFKVCSKAVA